MLIKMIPIIYIFIGSLVLMYNISYIILFMAGIFVGMYYTEYNSNPEFIKIYGDEAAVYFRSFAEYIENLVKNWK